MPMQITKLEAARRQLVIAIRLFFEDTDSVSVYALGHAAWEVLDALCRHRDLTRFRGEMAVANALSEAEIKRIANYGRNFFKHADTDPDALLDDFSDDRNDHVLLAATLDYGMLASTKPMEVQVFQFWYFAAHPDKALRPAMDQIIEAGQKYFPGIDKLTRKHQKEAVLRFCVAARRDPELMADPSTDRSPVSSIN